MSNWPSEVKQHPFWVSMKIAPGRRMVRVKLSSKQCGQRWNDRFILTMVHLLNPLPPAPNGPAFRSLGHCLPVVRISELPIPNLPHPGYELVTRISLSIRTGHEATSECLLLDSSSDIKKDWHWNERVAWHIDFLAWVGHARVGWANTARRVKSFGCYFNNWLIIMSFDLFLWKKGEFRVTFREVSRKSFDF